MAVIIGLNAINVMTLNTNASVAVGENNQVGWDSHQKQNSAMGPINGNAFSANSVNSMVDNDVLDYVVSDNDVKPGGQVQAT
ncbi:MAG TPA: hypothetical protein VFV52_03495 [Bacilli bacterium]|nr:hypothetical protein [Bacilli bacterium]